MSKDKEAEMYKTSLALPRELWVKAKVLAVTRGLQFQELVAIALTEYLAKGKGGAR